MKLVFDKYREQYQILGYKQFDSSEPINATFLKNGEPIDLSQYYINFECKKPDGNIVIDNENIIIKNICEIEMLLNEQVTVINGSIKCQFVLIHKENERQNTTFTFDMDIQQSVIGLNGYSRSLITIAEKLAKDVITATKLHKTLTDDIELGNLVSEDLVAKTTTGNNTVSELVAKTNTGNTTTNQLVEKTALADQKKKELETSTQTAIEKNNLLVGNTRIADDTNIKLNQTITSGQDSINKINATGNKSLVISSSNFVNNEYTWKHAMNNDSLIVNFIDNDTNEPLMPDYKILDKNNILIRNSVEHPNVKVILSASFYQGNALFGTNVEEFKSDSIGVGAKKVRLKDGNGVVENPVTDSDAVFMPDGSTKLTKKIEEVTTQLEQKANENEVRYKKELIEPGDFSASSKAMMTGGSVAIVEGASVSFSNLTNDIKNMYGSFEKEEYSVVTGFYDLSKNGVLNTGLSSYKSGEIGCNVGDRFKITSIVAGQNVCLAILLNDDTIIDKIGVGNQTSEIKYIDELIEIPNGVTKIRVTGKTNAPVVTKNTIIDLNVNLGSLKENISANQLDILETQFALCADKAVETETIDGFYQINTGTISNALSGYKTLKYIPKSNDEILSVSTSVAGENVAMVVFVDNDNNITYLNKGNPTSHVKYENVRVKTPSNTKYVYVTSYYSEVQPMIKLSEVNRGIGNETDIIKDKIDNLEFEKNELEKAICRPQKTNDFAWNKFNKAYITFVFDDGRHDLNKVYDIFKEYGFLLNVAIPSSFLDNKLDDGSLLKDLCHKIENNYGEVLCHFWDSNVITSDATEETVLHYLRDSKKVLVEEGFNIRGLIKAGGVNSVENLGEKWEYITRKYYDYGDQVGDSTQYNKTRIWLSQKSVEDVKNLIDNAILNKEWISLFAHTLDGTENNVNENNLRAILDYVKSKQDSQVKVIPYNWLYDNFGTTVLAKKINEIIG